MHFDNRRSEGFLQTWRSRGPWVHWNTVSESSGKRLYKYRLIHHIKRWRFVYSYSSCAVFFHIHILFTYAKCLYDTNVTKSSKTEYKYINRNFNQSIKYCISMSFSYLYSTENVPIKRALPPVVRDVSFSERCSAAVSEGDAWLLNLIRYSTTSE